MDCWIPQSTSIFPQRLGHVSPPSSSVSGLVSFCVREFVFLVAALLGDVPLPVTGAATPLRFLALSCSFFLCCPLRGSFTCPSFWYWVVLSQWGFFCPCSKSHFCFPDRCQRFFFLMVASPQPAWNLSRVRDLRDLPTSFFFFLFGFFPFSSSDGTRVIPWVSPFLTALRAFPPSTVFSFCVLASGPVIFFFERLLC